MDPFQVNMLAHVARLEELQEEMVKLLRSLCPIQGSQGTREPPAVKLKGAGDSSVNHDSDLLASSGNLDKQLNEIVEDSVMTTSTTPENNLTTNNTPLIPFIPGELGDDDDDLHSDGSSEYDNEEPVPGVTVSQDWIIDWDLWGLNERKRRVANIFHAMGKSEDLDPVAHLLLRDFRVDSNNIFDTSFIIQNFTHTGAISPIYIQDLTNSSSLISLIARRPRNEGRGRIVGIRKITPSSITIALMSAAVEYEMATIRADAMALYKHVSVDRACGFWRESDLELGPSLVPTWSFSVTYFALHDSLPDQEATPFGTSGIFSSASKHVAGQEKYIREEKLTVVFMFQNLIESDDKTIMFPDLSSLPMGSSWMLLTFGEPKDFSDIGTSPHSLFDWTRDCFEQIAFKWDTVLGELNQQIGVTSDVVFNSDVRRKLLFEDEDFSNSNRYFWALQSLRVFSDYVDQTLNILPNIFGVPDDEKKTHTLFARFTTLRERIEHKRQEVQALSDSLFAASSVMEARVAGEQNTTVRLLTLATVAFLPISLVTSFFSSNVVPEGAETFSAFITTSVILTILTFFVVFNINTSRWMFSRLYRRGTRRLEECMKQDQEEKWRIRGERLQTFFESRNVPEPSTTWWYIGFIFHTMRPSRIWSSFDMFILSYLRGSRVQNNPNDASRTNAFPA